MSAITKLIRNWFIRRKAREEAEAFLRQNETIKAIKAYRCAFEPITSLQEAVREVNKIRRRLGMPQIGEHR